VFVSLLVLALARRRKQWGQVDGVAEFRIGCTLRAALRIKIYMSARKLSNEEMRTYMLPAGDSSVLADDDAYGVVQRAPGEALELRALGHKCPSAFLVAGGLLRFAHLVDADGFELAGFALCFELGIVHLVCANRLKLARLLLLADDASAFLRRDLAPERVEVERGSLVVCGCGLWVLLLGEVRGGGRRLVLQTLNLLEPLAELILLALETFRSEVFCLGGLCLCEGCEVLLAGVLGYGGPIRRQGRWVQVRHSSGKFKWLDEGKVVVGKIRRLSPGFYRHLSKDARRDA
jgi:hypothetical protein